MVEVGKLTKPVMVRCGDCRYFVRDGRCRYYMSAAGRAPRQAFEHAPFWVWSDCYSDREQVRSNVETACPTFEARPSLASDQAQ
jgi:hypothetical protein